MYCFFHSRTPLAYPPHFMAGNKELVLQRLIESRLCFHTGNVSIIIVFQPWNEHFVLFLVELFQGLQFASSSLRSSRPLSTAVTHG